MMSSAFSQGQEDIPAETKKPPGFRPGTETQPLYLGRDVETNL